VKSQVRTLYMIFISWSSKQPRCHTQSLQMLLSVFGQAVLVKLSN